MFYKFKTISLFLALFMWMTAQKGLAQGPDSSYLVPNSVLISKLIAFNDLNTTIQLSNESNIIPLKGTYLSPNGQKIIKQGNEIYVLIEQTGFVYKLSSYDSTTCNFKRIDHTINLNYNIDCKNFIHKGQLFSYGGYGFWKSNGHLRKFNFEDSEWDIIPLNEEIMSSTYTWFDAKTGKLYVPIQKVVNAGVIGSDNVKGVNISTSYYLDLDQKKWTKLGELTSDVAKILQNDNTPGFLNLEEGLLHLVHDEAYIFDFTHNALLKSHNADLNQFLIRRSGLTNMFVYKGFIYSYVEASQSFNKYPFKLSDFEILKTGIWGNEKKFLILALIVLFGILIVVFITWLMNRIVKRKIEAEQLRMLKSKTVNQAFSATEVALIELMITASQKNTTVDIHQINHVLGIKDKNIGLQKKVRSDVMNAINDKYEFISHSNEILIASSRKEDDKRFFEYFINPSELKAIQRILENN